MIVYKFKIQFDNQDDYLLVDKFQQQYSSCLRVFYRILSKETQLQSEFYYLSNTSELSTRFFQLNNMDLMQTNTWIYRSCIKEAIQLYKTNQHIVFGGKRNLIKRNKGLITNTEWKELRKYPIYSIGTAKPYKGNQKFEILNDLETIIFKPTKSLHIPFKLSNIGNCRQLIKKLFDAQNSKQHPITYKLSKDYVWIMIDECAIHESKTHQPVSNRVMSIDMNPNYIGWTIIDWKSSCEFNIIKSGIISFKQINDLWFQLNTEGKYSASSDERKYIRNKLEYETYQVAKKLIDIALYYKVDLFGVEDLKFKNVQQQCKRLNTLCNNLWFRTKLINNINKRCNIHHIKLQKVQAQYSSIYGNLVFRSLNLPDMVLAAIEIGRRCYEFYNQWVIKSKHQQKNIIQPLIDDFKRFYTIALEEFGIVDKEFDSWFDLYSYIKNTLFNWARVPLDTINSLKVCRLDSQKSLINTIYIS